MWPAVALVATATAACSASGPPARACTEIGSPTGVSVRVEPAVVAPGLLLSLRVCQADCTEHRVELEPGSTTVGQSCTSGDPDGSCSASASPDGTLVGFVDVASLTPGDVRVSGTLETPGNSTRLAEVTLTASPTYPNGRDCPAGGPQALVRVTAGGLR